MKNQLAVGIDIGGTKIDFVLVNHHGETLESHRLPTLPEEGAEAVLDRLAEGARFLIDKAGGDVNGIGIGCPGHVDSLTGIVRNAVNLGWREVQLAEGLRRRLSVTLPVIADNDVNVAALGEAYWGAGRHVQDFVYLALGTGLGGAAVVNGEVVRGSSAFAMEIGHLALVPNGRQCPCGLHGCLEIYSSGVGVLAGVQEYLHEYPDTLLNAEPVSTQSILTAAKAGDPLALKVISEAGYWLGMGMACCAGLLNPAMIIIGGGFGFAFADLLLPTAEETMRARVMSQISSHLSIHKAQVQRIAVGAACLVIQTQDRKESVV